MMMDGLEDAYETGRSMGDFGEATAEAYQFTRADQDAYAMETLTPRPQGGRRRRVQGRDRADHGDRESRPAHRSPMTSIR